MAHILVVDDDRDTRKIVSHVLKRAGYQVTLAAGVAEGLSAMWQTDPDVVLTDLCMLDGSGQDILEHARKLPAAPPVIVMSGSFDSVTEPKLLLAGAKALLPKPFRLHELMAAVAATLVV